MPELALRSERGRAVARRARHRSRPPDDAGYFVQEGPLAVLQRLPALGRAGPRCTGSARACGCSRHDFDAGPRYGVGPRLADRLRGPPPLLRAGRARARRLRRRRRPGVPRPVVLDRLPLPDAPHPAQLRRHRGRGEARRAHRAPRRRGRRAEGHEHAAGAQQRAEPKLRRYRPVGAVGARLATAGCAARATRAASRSAPPRRSTTRSRRSAAPPPTASRSARSAVVSRVILSPDRRRVRALEYIPYDDGAARRHTTPRDRRGVRAGRQPGRERQAAADVGRGQLVRPARPQPDGPPVPARLGADARERRGVPRAELDVRARDAARRPFRRHRAAFRAELANWGWDFAAFAPYADVAEAVHGRGLSGTALRNWLARRIPRQVRLGFLLEQLPTPAQPRDARRPHGRARAAAPAHPATTSTTTRGAASRPRASAPRRRSR